MLFKFYFLALFGVVLSNALPNNGTETELPHENSQYVINIVLDLIKSFIRVHKVTKIAKNNHTIQLIHTIDLKYSTESFETILKEKLSETLQLEVIEVLLLTENIHINVLQTNSSSLMKTVVNTNYLEALRRINETSKFKNKIKISTFNSADKAWAHYLVAFKKKIIGWNDFLLYVDENSFVTGLPNLSYSFSSSEYALKQNVKYIVGATFDCYGIEMMKYRMFNHLITRQAHSDPSNKVIVHPCYHNNTQEFDKPEVFNRLCPGCDTKGTKNETLTDYKISGGFDVNKCLTFMTRTRAAFDEEIPNVSCNRLRLDSFNEAFTTSDEKLIFVQPGKNSLETELQLKNESPLMSNMEKECNMSMKGSTAEACFNAMYTYYIYIFHIRVNSTYKNFEILWDQFIIYDKLGLELNETLIRTQPARSLLFRIIEPIIKDKLFPSDKIIVPSIPKISYIPLQNPKSQTSTLSWTRSLRLFSAFMGVVVAVSFCVYSKRSRDRKKKYQQINTEETEQLTE